jgi:hypothetical protein
MSIMLTVLSIDAVAIQFTSCAFQSNELIGPLNSELFVSSMTGVAISSSVDTV